nr:hypothetical protein [Bordetella pertussis]
MKPLARAASRANREYLRAGPALYRGHAPAGARRRGGAAAGEETPETGERADADADLAWPGLAWPGLAAGPQERAYRVQQFRRGVLIA